jgi:outer membrane lipoprotein-sorting protein
VVSVRSWSSSLLLLAGLAAGCAIAVPPPHEPVAEDARRVVALLIDRWHAFSDMRSLADVVVQRGGSRYQFTGVLLMRAPSSLRFEALSPFGQPVFLLNIRDGELTAYDAVNNEATVGTATAETAASLFSLPVDPDDMVAVLAGHTVPPKDLRVASFLPPDAAGPSLRLVGRLHEQRIWMDFQTGVIRQLTITGGRADARIVYQRDADGHLTGLDVSAGGDYVTGTIRYRDPAFDAGVDPDRFAFTIPKGAKIQEIR